MKYVCDVPMAGKGKGFRELSLPAGTEIRGDRFTNEFEITLSPPTVGIRTLKFSLNLWDLDKLTEVSA